MVDEQQTCGKGLAEHSSLPRKLGELIAAQAANLEVHMHALDLTDPDSKKEYKVYEKLSGKFRYISAGLMEAATTMAERRDLPMGRHDEKKMSAAEVKDAFKKFLDLEQELLLLLEDRIRKDQQMLKQMG